MNTKSPLPKHTPGPWLADTGDVPQLGQAIGVLKQSHKPGEKGEAICIVALVKDAQPHDHANASLIASAPEMHELLQEAYNTISVYRKTSPGGEEWVDGLLKRIAVTLGHNVEVTRGEVDARSQQCG